MSRNGVPFIKTRNFSQIDFLLAFPACSGLQAQYEVETASMTDRRAFTLQPLVEAGVFEPGENVLSCSVGGVEYFAGGPLKAQNARLLIVDGHAESLKCH